MNRKKRSIHPIPGLGLRTIKTAIAVTLCLLTALLLNSWGIFHPYYTAAVPIFACTSAIICMQDTVESSVQYGLYRLFGTGVGGSIGFIFLFLNKNIYIQLLLCFVGIMLCVFLCNTAKMRQASAISCVVFVIIILADSRESFYVYAINRIAETSVGIIIAVAVNKLIPSKNLRPTPETENIPETEKIRFFDEFFDKYPKETERKMNNVCSAKDEVENIAEEAISSAEDGKIN